MEVLVGVEALRERGSHRVLHVCGDLPAHQIDELERRHRQAQRAEGLLDREQRRAFVHGPSSLAHDLREKTVDDEAGGVGGEDSVLAQPLGDEERGRKSRLVGGRCLHDLDQWHYRDRVEEVEPHESLGVLELLTDLLHRQRGGVGRENRVVGDDLLDLTEDLLLDPDLLENRLDHEVAVGVLVLVGGAVDERTKAIRTIPVESSLLLELADLFVDVGESLVDARLIKVGDQDRHLELSHEQQRELAGHEAGTDDPDLLDLLGKRLVGSADGSLGTLLYEVERVHGCRELIAGDEIGQCLILASEAFCFRAALGLVEKIERDVGGAGDRADAALQHPASHLDRDRPLGQTLDLARLVLALDLDRAGEDAIGPAQ